MSGPFHTHAPPGAAATVLRAIWRECGCIDCLRRLATNAGAGDDPAKGHKFHAKPVTAGERADGLTFASRAEARRYDQLRLLEASGLIHSIELQPRFQLVVNGVRIGAYVADFAYLDANGARHVEDVKGVRTPVYKLKAKLVQALHGIAIEEIGPEPRQPVRAPTKAA